MTAPAYDYTQGVPPRTELEMAWQLFDDLERARSTMVPWWRDVSRFFSPRAQRIDVQSENRGNMLNRHIVDERAVFARRTLASGLHWGVTNPSREWMQLGVADPEMAERPAVKEWLYTVNNRLFTVLGRSNFYHVQAGANEDWITYATAAYLIEEDERDIIRCVPFAIGSYAIGDDARGEVAAFSRRFQLTVRQLLEQFGERGPRGYRMEKFSQHVRDCVRRGTLEEKVEVCHLITPNQEFDGVREATEAKPFASYYWEYGQRPQDRAQEFLRKDGYDEWPVMVFRWRRVPGEAWGIDCPAMQVLGTAKSLQLVESKSLKLLDKAVDPPLVGPSSLQNKRVSLLPGDLTTDDDRDKQLRAIHQVELAALRAVTEKQVDMRQRIDDAFYVNLMTFVLSLAGKGDRTAREIEEGSQEKYLVLGTVLESANAEFSRMVDRVFAIMTRRGLIPPAPEELAGLPLKVKYTSIMAQAQEAVGLGNIERFGYWLADMVKATGDPSMALKVDLQQMVDEVGLRSGLPPRLVRSDEAVAEIEAAQAEAQQAMQRAEQAKLEADAANKLAGSDTSGKNALTDLLAASANSLPAQATGGIA